MRKLSILSLDVAKRMGWAHGRPGEAPRSGSVRFVEEKRERQLSPCTARTLYYRGLRQWLADFLTVNDADIVVYETPIAGMIRGNTNGDTIRLLIGLTEHIEEMLPGFNGIDLREAGASEVRKYFIGTGRPPKGTAKKMVMERCKALGWPYADDNAADALALWAYQAWCADRSFDLRGR